MLIPWQHNTPHAGCWDANMIDSILPDDDEIVLPKTSSSVFNSTNVHYILRNLSITHLVLCGCVTDQCVEHAVRDACDLGYYVTLVTGVQMGCQVMIWDPPLCTTRTSTDACATYSEARHNASLAAVKGYCRQRTTQQVVNELEQW